MLETTYTLVLIWTVSEIALSLRKRSTTKDHSADGHSLKVLWGVAIIFMSAAFTIAHMVPFGRYHLPPWAMLPIVALFLAGIALRWYAIVALGIFFTVNVAIRADHHLVTTGPYAIIRHPSYTGLLMMMLAIAVSFGNWLSALVVLLPFTAAILWRIHIEETALARNFGEKYHSYAARTKRLVPFLY